ncbi:hypothetical protein [Ureibacillus chungkukjangi]
MASVALSSNTNNFLSKYKLFETDEVQQVQLQHRLELVEAIGL